MNSDRELNTLGVSAAQFEAGGALWTAREIVQQPQIWLEVATLVAREKSRLESFLAPLLKRPDLALILTGAGTSSFVGECLAPALARKLGRAVEAISTTDLVASPGSWLRRETPTLLVSFARSGNSPESLAAVEVTQQAVKECAHLIFTCNPEGALYRQAANLPNACTLLMPEASDDRGFAMTSSFTGMLLAAALSLEALSLKDDPIPALTRAARQVLPGRATLIHDLVREGFERMVYLGSKELKGLAQEAALKMLELTDGRVVSIADSPLGFRHGPKTILNGQTLVVVFICNDPHTRRYDLDLVAELRREAVAGRVIALCGPRAPPPHEDDIALNECAPISDLELCLPYAMFAQGLALLRSLSVGVRPDTPNGSGTVNRVVQGVTIYPWDPSV